MKLIKRCKYGWISNYFFEANPAALDSFSVPKTVCILKAAWFFLCAVDTDYFPTMHCTGEMNDLVTTAKDLNKVWMVIRQHEEDLRKQVLLIIIYVLLLSLVTFEYVILSSWKLNFSQQNKYLINLEKNCLNYR